MEEGSSTTGGGTPSPVRGEASSAKKAPPAPAQSVPKRDEPVDPPNVPGDRRQESTVNEICSGASPVPSSSEVWQKIRSAAGAIKRSLGTYLDNCQLTALDAKEMRLSFSDPYTMGLVEKEENFEALKEAVAEVCGEPELKITLQLGTTTAAPATDTPAPPEPEQPKGKGSAKRGSATEEEILKDALDVFGGIVIR
jgi:hypothetical protein